MPAVIGGRYRPVRLLGRGGMGSVYEVEHVHTGQRLALKVLTAQPGASVERFKREARAASHIKSDHIVRITDADAAPELGGAPFLVMELLEGADLERMTATRPAAPADVVEWLRQTARGLGKAHAAGIVHRDLKPENLFLTQREDGSPLVKILDFGIAKMSLERTALTASDTLLGTPTYMAPEQTDSTGPPVTSRADLYSLGLITFKLLTGRLYWRDGSLAQLLAQILAEPMAPASTRGSAFGRAFDDWFARACSRDPEGRFASAAEQVEALATALGLPVEPLRPSGEPARQTVLSSADTQGPASLNGSSRDLRTARRRNTRRLFGGGVAAAVAAAGMGIVVIRSGAHPSPAPADSTGAARAVAEPAGHPPPATPPVAAPPPSTSSSPADAGLAAVPPPPTPALTVQAPKHKPAGPVASSRAASSAPAPAADGPKRRDPLEGPW